MVLPAVVDDFVAEGVAACVEFDLERIAADEQIRVEAGSRGDEHAEAVAVARFAEACERDAAGLQRKFIRDAFHAAAFDGGAAVQLRLEARAAELARRCAAMPCDAVFAFHDNHVAEERQVAGKDLRDAHHDGAIDVAFAGGQEAVVRQMAERGADGDAVEFVENDFRPAAHGERIDEELVFHLLDGAEQPRGFFQLAVTRAVGRMTWRV